MRVIKVFLVVCLMVGFPSCEELLEVTDISDEKVTLLAPSDSTVVVQSDVNFSWDPVFEASEYHIQVAAPSFENAAQIVLDSMVVLDSTFLSTRVTKILVDSDYEWRVKAMNSAYETEYSNSAFTVDTSNSQ